MEYTTVHHVDASPADVLAALSDPATWPHWQTGLTSVEQIDERNRALVFEFPGETMRMTETLQSAGPDHYEAIYESGGYWNQCDNLVEPDGTGARWSMHNVWRFAMDVEPNESDLERFLASSQAGQAALATWLENGRPQRATG